MFDSPRKEMVDFIGREEDISEERQCPEFVDCMWKKEENYWG